MTVLHRIGLLLLLFSGDKRKVWMWKSKLLVKLVPIVSNWLWRSRLGRELEYHLLRNESLKKTADTKVEEIDRANISKNKVNIFLIQMLIVCSVFKSDWKSKLFRRIEIKKKRLGKCKFVIVNDSTALSKPSNCFWYTGIHLNHLYSLDNTVFKSNVMTTILFSHVWTEILLDNVKHRTRSFHNTLEKKIRLIWNRT